MYKSLPPKGPKCPLRPRSHSLSPVLARANKKLTPQKSKGEINLQNSQKSSRSLVRLKSQLTSDESFPQLPTSMAEAVNLRVLKSDDVCGQESEGPTVTIMPAIPEKVNRMLSSRKREFAAKRKSLVALQNTVMEQLAAIKDIEHRSGIPHDEKLDKLSIMTLSNWPAHDILLLLKELMEVPASSEINSFLGSKVLEKVTEQLRPIHEDVMTICSELLTSLKQLSLRPVLSQHKASKIPYQISSRAKASKSSNSMTNFDIPKFGALIDNLGEKVKSRIELALRLMKLPWLDRDTLVKRVDILQKEVFALKHKTDENRTLESVYTKEAAPIEEPQRDHDKGPAVKKKNSAELEKHRIAMESMKEMVSTTENMLRVARARIVILEKELKMARAEVEALRRKQKENEQYIRQRDNAFEARLKKLVEHSKHGETALETLTRQRDALEVRVKELRHQAERAEKKIKERNLEVMQVKAMENNTDASLAMKCAELEKQVTEQQTQLKHLRDYSDKLIEVTKSKCLEYVPVRDTPDKAPTSMEVDIYLELKSTKIKMKQVEDDLHKSKADKEALLKSLYEIARGEGDEKENKLAEELLNRERKLSELQTVIDELRQQLIKKDQTQAELKNTIQALHVEFIKVRSYDTYNANDFSGIGIQEEIMDLYSRCDAMSRERTQLVAAAAARSLMLERYERAAGMFAQVVHARQALADAVDGKPAHLPNNMSISEMSRSLTALCENAVETWNALCDERTRVQRLESELAVRNRHLEREAKIRTHLERRRAALVRALMANPNTAAVNASPTKPSPKVKPASKSPEKKKYLARIGSLFKF